MRNKAGMICMILGVAFVLAALSLLLWNRQEDRKAGDSVEKLLPLVSEQMKKAADDGTYPDPYDSAMTEAEIDGYAYVGVLAIPTIGLEFPVMSGWDYSRLKVAPCRYSGSTKTDDLVIAAHNYRRHFGSLSKLSEGDEVYFTDMDGVLSVYEVVTVEVLTPDEVEEMTAGEYDLTLFTCTYGGRSRTTVRCERVPE